MSQKKQTTKVELDELEVRFLDLFLESCLGDLENKDSKLLEILPTDELKPLIYSLYEKVTVNLTDSKTIN